MGPDYPIGAYLLKLPVHRILTQSKWKIGNRFDQKFCCGMYNYKCDRGIIP